MHQRSRGLSLRVGDYRRVLLAALEPIAHPVALLTVTPPGHDALPPDAQAFRLWNRSAAQRWARLDRRAKGRLRREGLRVRPLARIAQRQRRGLDHLHVVLRATELDRHATQRYVEHLRDLAPSYGFGFIDNPYHHRRGKDGKARNMVYESPAIAGRYLCGYLTDSDQLTAMLTAGDHSFRPLWVHHELTQASGVNCRRLRRVRHAWYVTAAIAQGSRPTLPVWWTEIRERAAVLRLLRHEDRGPPGLAVAPG
jgi:hypothetical protein